MLNRNSSFLEQKAVYFSEHPKIRQRKSWYYHHYIYFRYNRRQIKKIAFLKKLRLPLYLSFLRWILIDILKGKDRKFNGIYQFVALPGEGKTLSMVAHMERARKAAPDLIIATNFNYKHQNYQINDWVDIVTYALEAHRLHRPCIIAMDEIHVTFDASDWQKFPPELLALLSFNRKFSLQFLCSSQI